MLRSNFLRGISVGRKYSTSTSTEASNDIEATLNALLTRVTSLKHQKAENRGGNRRSNQKFFKGPKSPQQNQSNSNHSHLLKSEDVTSTQSKQKKPFGIQKSRISSPTDEFGNFFTELSSEQQSFAPRDPATQKPRSSRQNSQQRRGGSFTSRKSRGPASRTANSAKSNRRTSTSSTVKSLPLKNSNFDAISTSYTPEQSSITELMLSSPLTSQTEQSRLIKAYQRLSIDSGADISGILTGKISSDISTSKILPQLKTLALKLNGEAVVNSLNSNSSIDYETKLKLLNPLVGLAPVHQINS